MYSVLIAEDEPAIRRVLIKIIQEAFEGVQLMEAFDGAHAIEQLMAHPCQVLLCDIKMPKKDGLEVLQWVREHQPNVSVIMISGHGDLDTAVSCMRMGARDYIAKPPDLNRLLDALRNALTPIETPMAEPARVLSPKKVSFEGMLGESPRMTELKSTIAQVAPTQARVLITGPNGSGKELVAQAIHQNSSRKHRPFIAVNCAAIPTELIESELFGHVKGAFTSAVKDKVGTFEQAHLGTLFLDEIGDMSLSAQAKVLRALQESGIQRVGGDKTIPVDVRFIAATNKDLSQEIAQGRFREDLYHRLSVIVLEVPPLSERLSDLPVLVEYFTQKVCRDQGIPTRIWHQDALSQLAKHPWPGNVRELSNAVERLIILGSDPIQVKDVDRLVRKII
ncbi:MAG: sigma-54 dependent transcriptional regulator [Flavobacteriaceae bacterium]|jgi:two-component system, NtrC family, nitrogen regulation response regulator NtrX|nr:sigma-54 dependent transcriptional regulator [Flavobacteriaceae bacterium]MDP4673955.1 sigma-54 dependent transcriptional regulator [Flavobacteriaceae bacterium]MDP4754741.1 sigma-54 dependent transcriptional regulator [Flavobacteriaceae bacterium]MDP4794514.1 sigma-54 dependent transcriptional regulator [Flavobacteriaceae bacterium]MDP4885287.1 sigma-54 dependent transcriptional regulator [Flavobacteriaceae bacterium]